MFRTALSGRGLDDAAWEILKRAEAVAQNAQLVSEALRHLASLLAKVGRHQEARARRSEAEALAVTFSCPAAQA